MKIRVDLSRCQGYGNCVAAAPDAFDLDEDAGLAVVLMPDPPAELHEAVRQAAAVCPVSAIEISE